MSFFEKIKDWLGILDDAGDFLDRADRTRDKVKRILDNIEDNGKRLSKKLNDIDDMDDLKMTMGFVRQANGHGDSLKSILQEELRDVDKLIRKARSSGFNEAVPALEKVKSTISGGLVKHRDFLSQLDRVVNSYNSVRRSENIELAVKLIAGALVGLLGTLVSMHVFNTSEGDAIRAARNMNEDLFRSHGARHWVPPIGDEPGHYEPGEFPTHPR